MFSIKTIPFLFIKPLKISTIIRSKPKIQNMIPILERLNKKDQDEIFENDKRYIKEKFGSEVAEHIIYENLVKDLLFLHKYYINHKAYNIADMISLRSYIKNIYVKHKNLPEPIHNTLLDILNKNNALNE